MKTTYDVAIIGSGLAGTAAAITLGKLGVSGITFEKGYPYKDKACGDAIMPSAVSILQELGLPATTFSTTGGSPFHSIQLVADSDVLWNHPLKGEPGWMVPRKFLDQQLREVASKYMDLEYGCRVLEVKQENKYLSLIFEQNKELKSIRSTSAIIATGAENKLARNLGICGQPRNSASVSIYTACDLPSGEITFDLTKILDKGYGWYFPVDGQSVNVGVFSMGDIPANLGALGRQYLESRGRFSDDTKWRGGKGPLWSSKGTKWHSDQGIVSCGDAAGLIDPISGEGITAALFSGCLAANKIYSYLADGCNTIHLQEYSKEIFSHFSSVYRLNLQRLVWKRLCGI
jgi:flavin-dependent dehydrogenase